ncbi:MAG TPA: PQQ-binding-like beta-propeller repeat protein, partial [Gemmataceae bacterium]|nr:PQQ-binding-like beta-propeller repeat protein [Gemmataceae bacterium]
MSDATPQLPRAAQAPEGQPTPAKTEPAPPQERRPRLVPAVVIVAFQWLFLAIPSVITLLQGRFDTLPSWIDLPPIAQFVIIMWTPVVTLIAILVWWLFASRLRWSDRGLGLLAFGLTGGAMWFLRHPTFGLMPIILYALPVITTAWVGWLLVTPFLGWRVRRAGLLVVFVLTWGYFDLIRFDGVTGGFSAELTYRWKPTAEEQYKAESPSTTSLAETTALLSLQPGDWPGFRGPNRDNRVTGVRLATDWKEHPPRLLWRHRIGPGWSSFAVVGTRLYTQEQLESDERIICSDTSTGAPLWVHADPTRFSEEIGGPGPRATPTFHEGKIYAQGASGLLNCLDAATGKVFWTRDILKDSGATLPMWGYAASPLVVQGMVVAFAGAPDGKALLGYHASSGKPAWSAGEGQNSYCSPQLARLSGIEQVLIATDAGVTSFDPATGKVLWKYSWPLEGMARIVQPALLGNDVVIGSPFGKGTRRVRLDLSANSWKDQQLWETFAINPYFNDFVIHKGHL